MSPFFKIVKIQIKSNLSRFSISVFLKLFLKSTVFSLGVLPSLRVNNFLSSMVQILLILSVKIKKKKKRDLYENDVYKDRIRSNNNTFRSKLITITIRNMQEEMYKLGCSKLYKLVHDEEACFLSWGGAPLLLKSLRDTIVHF